MRKSSDDSSSCSRSRSRDLSKKWTQAKYDAFLLRQKQNRFCRIQPFKTIAAPIKHQCSQCQRIWKPAPKKCLADDYYCPSCVLHHRNNVDRFEDPTLAWTSVVPNTFYVFRIKDNVTQEEFYKYGRTQNLSSEKRYSSTEKSRYAMSLVYESRGSLKAMTVIQNLWKWLANNKGLRPKFSEAQFHGATECIRLSAALLQRLIEISKQIGLRPLSSYKNILFSDLPAVVQQELSELCKGVFL